MIDIHTHLIPDIDDGVRNIEEALTLLNLAADSGITQIALTPHYLLPVHNSDLVEKIKNGVETIKKLVAENNIDLTICSGAELFLQGNLLPLIEDPFLRINKTCYYLLELPMASFPNRELLLKNLTEIRNNQSFSPILAHPERNIDVILNPEQLFIFVDYGVLIQLNAGSILGNFGKKIKNTSFFLIEHGKAHVVASDVHGLYSRSLQLFESRLEIEKRYGMEIADLLFVTNPGLILKGKIVESLPVYAKPVKKGFLSSLFERLW